MYTAEEKARLRYQWALDDYTIACDFLVASRGAERARLEVVRANYAEELRKAARTAARLGILDDAEYTKALWLVGCL